MVFRDDIHKNFYIENVNKTNSNMDSERKALFYALGLTQETRNHINDLYNFEENCIRCEGLNKGWQTSRTLKVCRLAFNLYNGFTGPDQDKASDYTPYYLFDCNLTSFMLLAIKVRFPYYGEGL